MQSSNQESQNNQAAIGCKEGELDKKFNEILNGVDSLLVDSPVEDTSMIVFARGKFDGKDCIQSKTIMGLRKSEKNESDASEILIMMFMFLCKKLGFKEDAAKKFITEQIQAANPKMESVDVALDDLLSPLFPNS